MRIKIFGGATAQLCPNGGPPMMEIDRDDWENVRLISCNTKLASLISEIL